MNIVFGRSELSDSLVKKFHYSGYVPSNIQYCTTLIQNENAVASVYYSIPATRWSENVLELCRLVRDENVYPKPILTQLISESIRFIKKDKKFDLLISFADSTHNHHGGVYQAASWNYHVLRKSSHDGFIINGEFVPRRTCNHRWGTSSRTRLLDILIPLGYSCEPHFDNGKHLYWKSLDNNGKRKAERLNLKSNQYPKPKFNE